MQAKPKKNVENDMVGDKIGRIYLGRQDLDELQTRKMKGLKRGRDTDLGDEAEKDDDVISEDERDLDNGVELKRSRLA